MSSSVFLSPSGRGQSDQSIVSQANTAGQISGSPQVDVIDLGKLLSILLAAKWVIIICLSISLLIAFTYLKIATPIFEANTLVQIEEKQSGLGALDSLAGFVETESNTVTEIEIIKSRMVLGKVVEQLELDVEIQPYRIPIIGDYLARAYQGDTVAAPWQGLAAYSVGGEKLKIETMVLPAAWMGKELVIRNLGSGYYQVLSPEQEGGEQEILSARVGETAKHANGIILKIVQLDANVGAEFSVTKRYPIDAIAKLRNRLSIQEVGRKSGIVRLSLVGEDAQAIRVTLDAVAQVYRQQNVNRMAAEADNSLAFLTKQLPIIKADLETAEQQLNAYRSQVESLDISLEAQSLLSQLVTLEEKANGLKLKEAEVSQRYKNTHPLYVALLEQKHALQQEKQLLTAKTEALPDKQQALLRLMRDVEVTNAVYVQMLNKTQEMRVLRASTVSYVRIIDPADVLTQTVSPKKPLILMAALVLGAAVAFMIIVLIRLLNPGLHDPNILQTYYQLPNFGVVPFSNNAKLLDRISVNVRDKKALFNNIGRRLRQRLWLSSEPLTADTQADMGSLLAVAHPEDHAVEAIRSIRTSLHFTMMGAQSNTLMITGATQGIGKSFISANLSVVLAQSKQKVLLIDADLRRGRVHEEFSRPRAPGVTETLAAHFASGAQANWREHIYACPASGVDIVTTGELPPNPSELLMSGAFLQFIEAANKEYDFVILDTPPILPVTDAVYLSGMVAATLFVVRDGVTRQVEVGTALNRLANADAAPAGYIYNGLQANRSIYSAGYYDNYSYTYGRTYESKREKSITGQPAS